ncbi:MAG TPA: glycosyltransferase family A protein, partial [Candidatus Nanopelagicales bacterium]|nr:glycosyltransferase family A protein [Candidatus Nanopelagicales bacterium]
MAPPESPSLTGGAVEELADLPEGPTRPERRDHVAAVLVCRDGARWLPAVLTLLARSDRTPHVVVAVDAGSTDATGRLLASAVAEGVVDEVVTVPAGTGFGAAVGA